MSPAPDPPEPPDPSERSEPAQPPGSAGPSAGSQRPGGRSGPVNRWVLGARPRTLPAAVVPVAVGTACAVGAGAPIALWRAALALVVSLSLQVATNFTNDYADGVRGTDAKRVGPTRLVASGLARPGEVRRAALIAFGVAGMAGLILAAVAGWQLLLVGAACMAAAWLYTGGPRPYGYVGLGELFVFVFFGLVATAGTTFVLVERLTGLSLAAAVPVGLLATALLVTNNLRDIPSDRAAAKRTLAVRLGEDRTRYLYVALVAAALLLSGVVAVASGRLPAVAALVAVAVAREPVEAVLDGARGPQLIPVLAGTGQVQLVFGLGFSLGLWLGGI